MQVQEVLPDVNFRSLLMAKEQRATRQAEWLYHYGKPVISLTLVTPGRKKTGACYDNLMGVAIQSCDQWLREQQWPVLDRKVLWLATGPEALWCVDHPAPEIKAHCIGLEQTHPLGRLWDFDVICPQHGPVGRRSLNVSSRRCLVCDEPAINCVRGDRHPVRQVILKVEKLINDWFARN